MLGEKFPQSNLCYIEGFQSVRSSRFYLVDMMRIQRAVDRSSNTLTYVRSSILLSQLKMRYLSSSYREAHPLLPQ